MSLDIRLMREQMEAYSSAARRVRSLAGAEPDPTARIYLEEAADKLERNAIAWRKKVDDRGIAEYQSGRAPR